MGNDTEPNSLRDDPNSKHISHRRLKPEIRRWIRFIFIESMGVGKGGRGAWFPWILKFYIFSKKGCLLSLKWVKCSIIYWLPLEKPTIAPPLEKIFPTIASLVLYRSTANIAQSLVADVPVFSYRWKLRYTSLPKKAAASWDFSVLLHVLPRYTIQAVDEPAFQFHRLLQITVFVSCLREGTHAGPFATEFSLSSPVGAAVSVVVEFVWDVVVADLFHALIGRQARNSSFRHSFATSRRNIICKIISSSRGGSREGDRPPPSLKPTEVTLLTIILYNSENKSR